MNNHVTEDERRKRIDIVYECIMDGMSTRECANYLTENYFKISNATVKDYIERMEKIDKNKFEEMMQIMKEHTPKSVKDNEEIRKRVRNVVVMLQAGYNFEEISNMLHETYFTVYRDFTTRLNLLTNQELEALGITKEVIEQIKQDLTNRSISNLKNSK